MKLILDGCILCDIELHIGMHLDVVGIHACHVFILTPVNVSCIAMSRTVTFETQALVLSFPSPPMLMPCPGPQFTLCMYTFEHPV